MTRHAVALAAVACLVGVLVLGVHWALSGLDTIVVSWR